MSFPELLPDPILVHDLGGAKVAAAVLAPACTINCTASERRCRKEMVTCLPSN